MNGLLLAVLLTVDEGKPPVYEIPAGSLLTVGADAPLELPHGYFLPDPAFKALDAELKDLQAKAATAAVTPEPVTIDIGVKGWLIGAAIFVTAGFALGFGVSYLVSK